MNGVNFELGSLRSKVFVVDDFYKNPDEVRDFALKQTFVDDIRYYKGRRTKEKYLMKGLKEVFENIINKKITRWDEYGMNGVFQWCHSNDDLVYHSDQQNWAGVLFLTPSAPFETGTSLFAHKETKIRDSHEKGFENCFKGGFYDKTKFDLVDSIGNVYNRLVIFSGKTIHSASGYFGQKLEDSRLFQIFFFD